MKSFVSVFGHVYVLASLLQPTETLDITLRFTRQLQDEIALHQNKLAAAAREADHDYLDGNTMMGSVRYIRNEARATIQTALHAAALVVRAFILLSILLVTTLVDGFKFYRHIVDTHFRSLTRKKRKIIKYLSKHPLDPSTIHAIETDNEDDDVGSTDTDALPSSSRPISDHLSWLKFFLPSNHTANNNHHYPCLTEIDVASSSNPTTTPAPSEIEQQNEWNGMSTHVPNSHTTTLFIGQNDDNDDGANSSSNRKNDMSPPSLSPSSSISKSSLSTTATTNKTRLFSIKKRQPSITKNVPSSPPRPLAIYSERPFTTSNTLITASQIPHSHSLGSSLSLRLKQPGRRLSLLFRNKTRIKKVVQS